MALSAKVGKFALTTGTANVSVTGLGFQPKAVLFLGTRQTADGSSAGGYVCMGVATSATARGSVMISMQDAVATSNTNGKVHNNACFGIYDTSSTNGLLDFVSMDADGFTVVPDDAFVGSYECGYLALGGDSLTNAAAGVLTNTSGIGTTAVTGLGFQPDSVIFLGGSGSTINTASGGASASIGVATSSASRVMAALGSKDNDATASVTHSILRTDRIAENFATGTGSAIWSIDFDSMDADGFTVEKVAAPGSGNFHMPYLALKGASATVGTFTLGTGAGTFAETGVGFKPTALLAFTTMQTTVTETALSDHAQLAVGVSTGASEHYATWAYDEDNLNPSDNARVQDSDKLLVEYGPAATFSLESELALSSFEADGFTLDQTDAAASAWLVGYVAFGPAAGFHKLAGKLGGKLSGKV